MRNSDAISARASAFTLIELLVVVSIIATLLSMLIPSLRSARQQAKTLVCSAHTAGIGRAAASYYSEQRGWLCGSPATSGSLMFTDTPPSPTEENLAGDATQIWDFTGSLAPTYMKTSLPANRVERMRALTEGIFDCPSNRFEAGG